MANWVVNNPEDRPGYVDIRTEDGARIYVLNYGWRGGLAPKALRQAHSQTVLDAHYFANAANEADAIREQDDAE